jgi:hypothetical protein
MVNINEPILNAAHTHSLNNRRVLATGGPCGCFHCLKTFEANEVKQWVGKDDATALCPFCHYDTVLSSKVDPIDDGFLRRMNARWFGKTTKLDLTAELEKMRKINVP